MAVIKYALTVALLVAVASGAVRRQKVNLSPSLLTIPLVFC
jgi:hypothetical protein